MNSENLSDSDKNRPYRGLTTENIVGAMCLHISRCKSCERSQEPGQGLLTVITVGFLLAGELHARLTPDDYGWYRDEVFAPIGLHRSAEKGAK